MPFTLAGNTFSFMWDRPVVEALDALGALGLSTFDVIVTPGHLWHSELEGAGRATLRRTLEERNYTLDSLNPPATDYNLASLTPDVRQLAIGMYRETINLAADLRQRRRRGAGARLKPPAPAARTTLGCA